MQRRRLWSHLAAIMVTLIVVIGLPRLPALIGLGLPSWFSFAWLLFAVVVLLAHLQVAQLFGTGKRKSKRRSRLEG